MPEQVVPRASRRPTRRRVMVAVVLFTLTISLGSAELLSRLLPSRSGPQSRPIDSDAVGLPVLQTTSDILRPNVRGQYFGRLYTSNHNSIRGPEVPKHKLPGTFRIVVLGDSFTLGLGVRYEESYPALLSDRLNQRWADRRYEVVNLGASGFNLHASLQRLRLFDLEFEPADLIIYGFTPNDIEGADYRESHAPGSTEWTTSSRLLNLVGNGWAHLRELFWPARGSYLWELNDNYFHNPAALGSWRQDLEGLKFIAGTNHACLVVLIHPNLSDLHWLHPFRPIYDAVVAAAQSGGAFAIDPLPYFRSRDPQDLWVGRYDQHPNPEGHSILAEALTYGLLNLPPHCWKNGLHGRSAPLVPSE